MTRRAPALLALALVLSGGAPRDARAQTSSDDAARALFIEGSKLGSQGRWPEAMARYAASLELRPAALTRYSLGVAQRETAHFADALVSFRAFLAEAPSTATLPYVQPAQAAVTELRTQVGALSLTVDPPSIPELSLTLDGKPADRAPLRDIDPGPHEIIGRAPGFEESGSRFQARPTAITHVTLTLRPKGPVPASPDLGPRSTPAGLPMVLVGAGGGLFLTGAVVGLVGVKQASDAPTRDGLDAHAGRSKAIAGDVLAVSGLVAVGIGVALLVIGGRSTSAARVSRSGLWSGGAIRF